MSKPIVFIGAAGAMCQMVVQRLVNVIHTPLVLADINTEPVEALANSLPAGRTTVLKLDLFNHEALTDAIKGAALVILGAGPYTRTAKPVMEACLAAKVPYLDFDDDVESTQAALELSERAKSEGVAIFIGCGESPGLSNVIAMDATSQLDVVNSIELFWLVGNEKSGAGKAVVEHLMHIASGPCLTWVDGKPQIVESYLETKWAPMIGDSEMMLHETAHPEPTTLPRLFPQAHSIRCFGGLYPPAKFGCARGLADAVRRGILPIGEAGDWQLKARHGELEPEVGGQALLELTEYFPKLKVDEKTTQLIKQAKGAHRAGTYAVQGLVDQIRRGETTEEDVRDFLSEAAGLTKKVETPGALAVRAIGTRKGYPTVIIKRTPVGKDPIFMKNMANATGTACAAFALLAIQVEKSLSGVFCPENWAEPQALYRALETLGVPKEELPETYVY